MRRVICAIAVAMFAGVWLTAGAFAQEKLSREEAEAILVQSMLEQAAFLACATHARDTETASYLRKGGQKDLEESATLLRTSGFPDDYLKPLMARLDIEKAAPKFASGAAAKAFCETIGDWDRRRAMFFYSIPQLRLGQALKR